MFQEKIDVLMSTVFVAKMLKKRKPRKKGPERGMQDGGGGSGVDPLFPPKIERTKRGSKIEIVNDIAILFKYLMKDFCTLSFTSTVNFPVFFSSRTSGYKRL